MKKIVRTFILLVGLAAILAPAFAANDDKSTAPAGGKAVACASCHI